MASTGCITSSTTKRLSLSIEAANIASAFVVAGYTQLLPAGAESRFSRTHDAVLSAVVLALYLAVAIPLGQLLCRRTAQRAEAAAARGDSGVLLTLPSVFARQSFLMWVDAAIVFGLLNWWFDPSGLQTAHVVVGILLAGCTTVGIVYLLTERELRPLFAQALAGRQPDARCALGIRRRLLLSWALGSGVVLLGVLLTPLGLTDQQRGDVALPLSILAVIGLVSGWLLVDRAARSIGEPLSRLRTALERLQAGDLDVSVEVDDGGEIGVVQSGFNAAVAGLRERRRVEQLFGRQVGEQVARRAIETDTAPGSALAVERSECSVLFVDLVNSTGVVNSRSPEDVVAMFTLVYDALVRHVHAEGGWVNKFQGDGAMCVFGAPAAYDDHAARALRAARALHREFLALSATVAGLDAAVGVSAGTVVAGDVGSAERYEYTVIGRPVHEAARLTDEAKRRLGRVLASDEVVDRAGEEARHWAGGGEVALRGIPDPVRVFEPAPAAQTVPA